MEWALGKGERKMEVREHEAGWMILFNSETEAQGIANYLTGIYLTKEAERQMAIEANKIATKDCSYEKTDESAD